VGRKCRGGTREEESSATAERGFLKKTAGGRPYMQEKKEENEIALGGENERRKEKVGTLKIRKRENKKVKTFPRGTQRAIHKHKKEPIS